MKNNVRLWSNEEDDWLRELWTNVFVLKIIEKNLTKTKACEQISKRFETRDYIRSPEAISRRLVFLSMSIGCFVFFVCCKTLYKTKTQNAQYR